LPISEVPVVRQVIVSPNQYQMMYAMTLLPTSALGALLALTAAAVYPYQLHEFNIHRIPAWMRPPLEYVDGRYPYYYPAAESRAVLCAALVLAALLTVYSPMLMAWDVYGYLPFFIAGIPAAYLLHRHFCLHKLNEHTPLYIIGRTRWYNHYSVTRVLAVWAVPALVFMFGVTGIISVEWLRRSIAVFSMAALVVMCTELVQEMHALNADTPESLPSFVEMVPFSYYLLYALVVLPLMMWAVWSSGKIVLGAGVAAILIFGIIEYPLRFRCWQLATETVEQWGTDRTCPRFDPFELHWHRMRCERKALRRHCGSVLLMVSTGGDLIHFSPRSRNTLRISITADADNKINDLMECGERLVYVRGFPTYAQAREYTKTAFTTGRLRERIRSINPEMKDLKAMPIGQMMQYDNEIEITI
jgi:hypothetical protein